MESRIESKNHHRRVEACWTIHRQEVACLCCYVQTRCRDHPHFESHPVDPVDPVNFSNVAIETLLSCLPLLLSSQQLQGATLEYRKLGNTGLDVSVLGLGGSSLGSVFRPVEIDEAIRCVHLALDLGINLIDVAPCYGRKKAERVLGMALRHVGRHRYTLMTKVGRYGVDRFNFSARRVIKSVDQSLSRLGADVIDVIQCHSIEFARIDQIVNETLPALETLRQQGKVRFIGVTGLPLRIFGDVLDRVPIDTVLSYCHYTLNDATLQTQLDYLERKQVGIINASPLAMGLLTHRGPPGWHPAGKPIRSACARAADHCRRNGADLAQLAIRFAVSNPRIHTTLVGTASPANIERNVKWIDDPPDPELLEQVRRILKPVQDQTWPSGRAEA